MTKIILSGCNGKMGQTIINLVKTIEDATIVAGIDILSNPEELFPVFTHPSLCDCDADVIIDFSRPSAIENLVKLAKNKNMGLAIATTGLEEHHHMILKEASNSIPILLASNMSLGVNLLLELVKTASKALLENFDVEIIEKHHNSKVDAPSGTALTIADTINSVLDNEKPYVYERASKTEKRSKDEIGIHSIRAGTIVGEHDVLYSGQNEMIQISHKAYSRDIFASGAIKCAKFLKTKKSGFYSMQDLFS